MSKTVTTPTNDEMMELIQSYGNEHKVEVLTAIEAQEDEKGITLDVDQGFIEMFETTYPGVSIDDCLQAFFENAIENFVEQMENDPEFAKEVKRFGESKEKEA